ncbi:MAG: CCA tRNA nucleotidyltransferase, partial [Bacilli bacterium]|nr:CCA tRNA nucleotidyltransferase [Bacilli bacterium]
MQNILNKLPKSVLNVLKILENNGFQAYIVGGAVRDALLSRKIGDFDICTNALPIDIRKVFLEQKYKVIETGIKHGTVSVVNNNTAYEITTFRADGNYLDNRHPDKVTFNVSLEEDLKRRDFTINALACDAYGNIIDYHDGIKDLRNKIIRTVGNPNDRFKEDALIILRALRFKAVLGFTIEDKTKNAMFNKAELVKNVSIERINQEVKKILDCSYKNYKEYEKILRIAYDYNLHLKKKDYNIIGRLPDYIMKIAYLYSFYENDELISRLNNLKI